MVVVRLANGPRGIDPLRAGPGMQGVGLTPTRLAPDSFDRSKSPQPTSARDHAEVEPEESARVQARAGRLPWISVSGAGHEPDSGHHQRRLNELVDVDFGARRRRIGVCAPFGQAQSRALQTLSWGVCANTSSSRVDCPVASRVTAAVLASPQPWTYAGPKQIRPSHGVRCARHRGRAQRAPRG